MLDPTRNEQGKIHGGTVRVNDQADRSGLSKALLRQYEKGHDPQILLRGADLNKSEEQSLKSPISRLDDKLGGFDKPTYEREKQVNPQQQQEADIREQRATIKPIEPTLGQQGRGPTPAQKREPTMIEKMQARQKEQGQQPETPVQQPKRTITPGQGFSR